MYKRQPLVAVVAGVVLYLGFNSVESMKLERDHLVSLPEKIEITTPSFDPSKITSEEARAAEANAAASAAKEIKANSETAGNSATNAPGEGTEAASLKTSTNLASVSVPSVSVPSAMLGIIITALTLAVVASLESLLCAEATDKLDPQRRQTDLNQELRAQGIGNFVSGIFGGLPVTQVIVRSSTNIQSGAQSRLAAFVHGIFLIFCVVAIPNVLNMIPLASLAAILFIVGYKLAHPSKFIAMYKLGKTQFLPFMITVVAILRTDLLVGIGIGLVASLFFILKGSYVKSIWMSESQEDGKKVHRMTLAERVFFINKGHILNALQSVEDGEKLVIDASDSVHIDQDVIDLINDFETNAVFKNIEVARIGFLKEAKSKADPARVKRISEPSQDG